MKNALIWASLAVASMAMPGHCHAQQWSSMDDLYRDLSHYSAIVSREAGGDDATADATAFGAGGYISGVFTGMAVAKWNRGEKTPCLPTQPSPIALVRQVLAAVDADSKYRSGPPQYMTPMVMVHLFPCLK